MLGRELGVIVNWEWVGDKGIKGSGYLFILLACSFVVVLGFFRLRG